MRIDKNKINKIVIKVGTNLLTTDDSQFNVEKVELICSQIIELQKNNKQIVLISSGAIALGKRKVNITEKMMGIELKQATAAIGQTLLISEWNKVFNKSKVITAQALLSRNDFINSTSSKNAKNALLKLLELNIITIINENDVVSTEEIENSIIGDNDNLSALVAKLIDADLLIILTDQDGLYDKNPNKSDDSKLLTEIRDINNEILNAAESTTNKHGTGGMATKIEAANLAMEAGIHVVIANGNEKNIVHKIINNEKIGTHFLPKDN
jgi:glutamate 5-kinase